MSFTHPLLFLLLLLPAAWIVLAWRTAPRRSLLILKAAGMVAIVAALAEPVFTYSDPKVAVAVLVDTSLSLTPDDLERASRTVGQIERARGSNPVTVVPFARTTRSLTPSETSSGKLEFSTGDAARATNLEVAIRDAIAGLPSDAVRRVALITDGNENLGSVTRAAWQAQQLGIAIDTFPLAGRTRPGLRVESVSAPEEVFSGERFPVELTVTSSDSTQASAEFEAEGRKLGSQELTLQPGENHVRLRAELNTTGAVALSGRITANAAGRANASGAAPFEYAMTVRRPRALVMSEDPVEADAHLDQILSANQFDVDRTRSLPADLTPYQLILYNNWNMESIPEAEQARLEGFEQQGGGLLWIAGEKNVYVDRKGAPEPPLARALPAKLAPPQSPQGTAVILIIDKSSSMEGKKMDLARLASIGVVENLKPEDWVAVLIFDNSFQWAVPLRKAEDRSQIKRLISGITPDGGTQIAPALAEAFNKIKPVNAVYKHIVLLTDGISEEGDSLTLAREASADHVTISTVGLGQDVNRAYLEKIASNSKGKSYFLIEPAGLEQILLKDVREHTGTTAVEKALKPEVVSKSDLLEGVDMAAAPPLDGYVRFEARPDADEILKLEKDPLLVRWQYGLGRSAVFTSDAKNRWANAWLSWKDFDRFWTNLIRDLLPHAPPSEATAEYDPASEELVIDYRLAAHVTEPSKTPDIFALGPGQFRKAAQVTRVAKNEYRARVRIGSAQGLFRVRPLEESRAFPEIGFYRNESELTDFGANESLLRQLSNSTGGRFSGEPGQVFDSGGRSNLATLRLWPGLLALAILLNLTELLARKWKGLREWLPARIPLFS
jgi:Ca-activated chloride channel family protein